jgi:mediator of RNA polymerase II transcription subunit 14
VLKYLAVLRWKLAVDTVQYTPDPSSSFPAHPNGVGINNQDNDISSMKMEAEAASPEDAMTPAQGMMNGDVNGSAGGHGKGKGRTEDAAGGDGGQAIGQRIKRGRLLDIRRLEEFMKHQNAQHAMAVTHIQHVCAGIENLRYVWTFLHPERRPRRVTSCSRSMGHRSWRIIFNLHAESGIPTS